VPCPWKIELIIKIYNRRKKREECKRERGTVDNLRKEYMEYVMILRAQQMFHSHTVIYRADVGPIMSDLSRIYQAAFISTPCLCTTFIRI